MPKDRPEVCVQPILPPGVSERISAHYGCNYLSRRMMAPFWRKFNRDGAFHDQIWRKAKELFDIIFDEASDSWGNWPSNPQECAGIGYILGKLVENDIDEMLMQAPESELARLDTMVKAEGLSLFDYVLKHLQETKSRGNGDNETGRPVSLLICPCPRSF
jgi:hypothetical protein